MQGEKKEREETTKKKRRRRKKLSTFLEGYKEEKQINSEHNKTRNISCSFALQPAQDAPKAEVPGGFSYLRTVDLSSFNLYGWNAAVAGNLNRWFGMVMGAYIKELAQFDHFLGRSGKLFLYRFLGIALIQRLGPLRDCLGRDPAWSKNSAGVKRL